MSRGFASMTKERRKEVAKMGGRFAHVLGKAHEFTSAEGKIARSKRRKANNA